MVPVQGAGVKKRAWSRRFGRPGRTPRREYYRLATVNRKNRIPLRTGSWCGEREFELSFPDHWSVTVHSGNMPGPLSEEEIDERLENPEDGPQLSGLMDKDKTVAILIDDHTRPTPVVRVLRHLLAEAEKAGVPRANIKILVALGTHILEDRSFMESKLPGILGGNIEVLFPDCRDNAELKLVGRSNLGIPVYVNRVFAEADVKIAVSGIYPHDEAGFSGGAKIMIGVLGLRTLSLFHRKFSLLERGRDIETPFRDELESFARLAGVNYSINIVSNDRKEISELFCGDFKVAFRRAAAFASNCCRTTSDPEADIVVSNAYPLDTSLCVLGKSTWPFRRAGKKTFRILVTSLCDCSGYRLPFSSSDRELRFQKFKKLLYITQFKKEFNRLKLLLLSRAFPARKWRAPYVIYVPHVSDDVKKRKRVHGNCVMEYSWEDIVGELSREFPADYSPRVSVYSCAPLLYPMKNDE